MCLCIVCICVMTLRAAAGYISVLTSSGPDMYPESLFQGISYWLHDGRKLNQTVTNTIRNGHNDIHTEKTQQPTSCITVITNTNNTTTDIQYINIKDNTIG